MATIGTSKNKLPQNVATSAQNIYNQNQQPAKLEPLDIIFEHGNIVNSKADAIVNAANNQLQNGGGVCGAIHNAAGPKLTIACNKLGGCPTGQAKVTKGFDLKCQAIIHGVGPNCNIIKNEDEQDELLTSTYNNIIQAAHDHKPKITSLDIPSISTGIYGFDLERAARIAVTTVYSKLKLLKSQIQVKFCFFDPTNQTEAERVKKAYVKAWKALDKIPTDSSTSNFNPNAERERFVSRINAGENKSQPKHLADPTASNTISTNLKEANNQEIQEANSLSFTNESSSPALNKSTQPSEINVAQKIKNPIGLRPEKHNIPNKPPFASSIVNEEFHEQAPSTSAAAAPQALLKKAEKSVQLQNSKPPIEVMSAAIETKQLERESADAGPNITIKRQNINKSGAQAIVSAAGDDPTNIKGDAAGCIAGRLCIRETSNHAEWPFDEYGSNKITHTVAPEGPWDEYNQEDLLRSTYQQIIKKANMAGLKSLAIPTISTGTYGFDEKKAAEIAVSTVFKEMQGLSNLKGVAFYLSENDGIDIDGEYVAALENARMKLLSKSHTNFNDANPTTPTDQVITIRQNSNNSRGQIVNFFTKRRAEVADGSVEPQNQTTGPKNLEDSEAEEKNKLSNIVETKLKLFDETDPPAQIGSVATTDQNGENLTMQIKIPHEESQISQPEITIQSDKKSINEAGKKTKQDITQTPDQKTPQSKTPISGNKNTAATAIQSLNNNDIKILAEAPAHTEIGSNKIIIATEINNQEAPGSNPLSLTKSQPPLDSAEIQKLESIQKIDARVNDILDNPLNFSILSTPAYDAISEPYPGTLEYVHELSNWVDSGSTQDVVASRKKLMNEIIDWIKTPDRKPFNISAIDKEERDSIPVPPMDSTKGNEFIMEYEDKRVPNNRNQRFYI